MYQNVRYELHKLESIFAVSPSCVSEPVGDGYRRTEKPGAIQKEIARIRQCLVEKAFTFEDEALLERYIQFHHKGVVSLMDQIFANGASPLSADLHEHLGELLSFIERNFEKYADGETKVPDNHSNLFRSEVAGKLQILERKMAESSADQRLIELLLRPLKKFSVAESHMPVTYRKLRYLRQLQKQLFRAVVKTPGGCTDQDLRLMMYHLNYNAKKSFAYLSNYITADITKCETNVEKIERLSLLLKEVNQAPVNGDLSYRPELPSLKTQVSLFLAEEIEHLGRIRNLPKGLTDPENIISEFTLKLEISVPQLACILRLLFDASIIQNQNTTEVLRFVARFFTTKRAEVVSVGSLRRKFYDVEHGTRDSVRRLLLDMVNRIDKKL